MDIVASSKGRETWANAAPNARHFDILPVIERASETAAAHFNFGPRGVKMSGYTEHQKTMLATWERHGYAEFVLKDPDAAIATMSANPYILCVPLGQLLRGREQVYSFYSKDFLPNIPDSVELEPMARVVGENHIADEFLFRFIHDREMPWKLPGIPPTGRKVEVVMSVIVGFHGDKMAYEHLMWDHASVLHQIGLLDLPEASIGTPSPANLREMVRNASEGAH